MKAVDIVATGLSGGFIALCIGIAAGMNGSLIAFATTIAGFLGTYLGIPKIIGVLKGNDTRNGSK